MDMRCKFYLPETDETIEMPLNHILEYLHKVRYIDRIPYECYTLCDDTGIYKLFEKRTRQDIIAEDIKRERARRQVFLGEVKDVTDEELEWLQAMWDEDDRTARAAKRRNNS